MVNKFTIYDVDEEVERMREEILATLAKSEDVSIPGLDVDKLLDGRTLRPRAIARLKAREKGGETNGEGQE